MHEGDDRTADNATRGRRQESHDQDQDREESPELVFPQCDEGHQGGAGVDENGGEEGPQKDMVPHFAKGIETRLRPETHHIGDGVHSSVSSENMAKTVSNGSLRGMPEY